MDWIFSSCYLISLPAVENKLNQLRLTRWNKTQTSMQINDQFNLKMELNFDFSWKKEDFKTIAKTPRSLYIVSPRRVFFLFIHTVLCSMCFRLKWNTWMCCVVLILKYEAAFYYSSPYSNECSETLKGIVAGAGSKPSYKYCWLCQIVIA